MCIYNTKQVKKVDQIKPPYFSKEQVVTQIELEKCDQYFHS